MDKRTRRLSLVLVPILLAGCGEDIPDDMQRDVYTKFEDCMADWGKTELCQQMAAPEAQQFAGQAASASAPGNSSSAGSHLIFWGPSYYPGNRVVDYGGQRFAPTTNRAMPRPFAVTSKSSLAARSSPGTAARSSAARGGFGSGGRAAGHSSGG